MLTVDYGHKQEKMYILENIHKSAKEENSSFGQDTFTEIPLKMRGRKHINAFTLCGNPHLTASNLWKVFQALSIVFPAELHNLHWHCKPTASKTFNQLQRSNIPILMYFHGTPPAHNPFKRWWLHSGWQTAVSAIKIESQFKILDNQMHKHRASSSTLPLVYK